MIVEVKWYKCDKCGALWRAEAGWKPDQESTCPEWFKSKRRQTDHPHNML